MIHNSHKYTSLKLSCKVSLKCTELSPFCEYFQTVNNRCYGSCYVEKQLSQFQCQRKIVSKYDLQMVKHVESSRSEKIFFWRKI